MSVINMDHLQVKYIANNHIIIFPAWLIDEFVNQPVLIEKYFESIYH